MSALQSTELNKLEILVRQGLYPDTPSVLSNYLESADDIVNSISSANQEWQIFSRVSKTLLDTICDEYVSSHWRTLCLDNIYKPILKLQGLASTSQEKELTRLFQYKLSVLGQHFSTESYTTT